MDITLFDLPKDIWFLIANHLHTSDVNNLYRSSKVFNVCINSFEVCECNLLPLQKWTITKAAISGHLEIIEWLHEDREEGCTTTAMNWAAGNGHLHVVEWLHENRTEGCTYRAMIGLLGTNIYML